MSYLACDPNKIARARKAAMGRSQVIDNQKYEGEKIIGMGYDEDRISKPEPWCRTALAR